jgi:predicted dithiol-disulfide oxidoreductase (DUF899 family)
VLERDFPPLRSCGILPGASGEFLLRAQDFAARIAAEVIKMKTEIQKLEEEMMNLGTRLAKLRRESAPEPVKNYTFRTTEGKASLLELFGEKEVLFAIHNMGQGCRYCTTWADGLNGFVSHLEDNFSLVLLSKDPPEVQRRFANSRGWRFRMASHEGGEYQREQSIAGDGSNYPGVVVYVRKGKEIFRKNASAFGPGDQFCAIWPLLSLAGIGEEEWTPQYTYWKRPQTMDDGGQNLA